MNETKQILCHFSFYDQVRIQEKLEEMAELGWMIDQPGNFTWTFKRMEPKKLRFAVTYFPASSDFDPGPTEAELTKLDFCAQDGQSPRVGSASGSLGSRDVTPVSWFFFNMYLVEGIFFFDSRQEGKLLC